jgi:hypothetical protein
MIKTQINTYNSSMITGSSYNFEHKILTVHFNGATYVYEGVDPETYSQFANAESQGRALNEHIKGKFEFSKINLEETAQ